MISMQFVFFAFTVIGIHLKSAEPYKNPSQFWMIRCEKFNK